MWIETIKFRILVYKTRWLQKSKGDAAARIYSSEAALSLRVRLRGTKFAAPLVAELLIKYQRLPRGFFWNISLPSLVCWLFYFLKSRCYDNLWNRSEEICRKNFQKGQYFYDFQSFAITIYIKQKKGVFYENIKTHHYWQ